MEYVIGGLGFFVGLFLWSSIFGSLFGTIPVEKEMVRAGIIPKIRWSKIIVAIAFAVIVLGLSAFFAKTIFYGALIGGVVMLFNIGKLRAEAIQNFHDEQKRQNPNK